MSFREFGQSLVLLLLASACTTTAVCKVGDESSCPPEAFCYAGKNEKTGDKGICLFKPAIHSFSPLDAAHGASLRIRGVGFGTDASKTSVTLNGIPATLLLATETELEVEVPKSMQCTGLVKVSVDGRTAVSATDFSYVPTAIVSTFAGGGTTQSIDGRGLAAKFYSPDNIAIDAQGNLFVTDSNHNRIRKISPDREVSTLAGSGVAGWLDNSEGVKAQFNFPTGLAVDLSGNFYVADHFTHRIRKISPTGEVSTLAGLGKIGPDGGGFADGPQESAEFNRPDGIVLDAAGHLYVADSYNNRIRKVLPHGEVSTFAGSGTPGWLDSATGLDAYFNDPNGIAMDDAGNFYVADSGNNRIRKISPSGEVSTLAGSEVEGFLDGPGTAARFHFPHGLAIDNTRGYLYVADVRNHRIRLILPNGEVRTIAGGAEGYADGVGSDARFRSLRGVAIDAEGNLYVADSNNNRIRKIVLE